VSSEPTPHSKRNVGLGALGFGFGLVLTLLQWGGVHLGKGLFIGGLIAAVVICLYGFGAFLWGRSPWTLVRTADWEAARTRPTVDGHGDQEETSRRELLRLARLVHRELATCDSQITDARARQTAWTSDRPLPTAAYEQWIAAVDTVDENKVNSALEPFYVWAARANERISDAGQEGESRLGTVLVQMSLGMELQKGLGHIKHAQAYLNARINELSR
jgi:hypothetical protein